MESIYNYQKNQNPTSTSNNALRNLLIGGIALISGLILLIVVYAVVSPFISLYGMRSAALAHDGKRFASYIDFPVFKENVKAELNASIISSMSKDLKDNPFGGLGMVLVPTMINNLVDAMVTPQGVEHMMDGQVVPQADKSVAPSKNMNPFTSDDVSWHYESAIQFYIDMKNPNGTIDSLVFERHWIGDWKLASLKLAGR